jgi:hypothetical protein
MMKGGQTSQFGRAVEALMQLFRASGVEISATAAADAVLAPHRIPVSAWLERALEHSSPSTGAACAALAQVAPLLSWRRNAGYRDADFLSRYGYCELLGPAGHRVDPSIALGVLLLAPRTCYPPHRHPANELYVVLAGSAQWRISEGDWVARASGAVIHHPSMTTHAMRTDEEPLLAAYLWTDHLATPATLV